MPIRLRLTLLYVGLLAISLAICGVATYIIAADRIYSSVDDSLSVRSEALLQVFRDSGADLTDTAVEAKRPELDEQSSADLVFQIRARDGRVLYSSAQPLSSSLPPPGVSESGRSFATRQVAGVDLRILYEPLINQSDEVGTVEVAQSLRPTESALSEIRGVFVIAGLIAVVITTAAAYTLAGNALSPVREVSRVAQEIEQTADFGRRLQVARTRDEVSELMVTFNAMIDRVEQTMTGQRAFLADSSHELRRPLTVIRANLDVIADPALPPLERRDCINEMELEARLMSKVLGDLLLLAREQSHAVQKAPVDLTELCRRTVTSFPSVTAHKIVGEFDEDIVIDGDGDRIEQLLNNLMENAALYSPPASSVGVSLRREGDLAIIEVTNAGEGIPPAELPHVFERFFRGATAVASRPDGTGLGLAIVKYIAEAHDGKVSASSEPGELTRFRVELPAIPGLPRQL